MLGFLFHWRGLNTCLLDLQQCKTLQFCVFHGYKFLNLNEWEFLYIKFYFTTTASHWSKKVSRMISFILWNHPNETSIIIISSLVKVVEKRHRKFFKSTHSKQETKNWSRAVWFLRLFSPTYDILNSMLYSTLFDKFSPFLVKKYLWKHFK